MYLDQIQVQNIRVISSAKIKLSPRFNIITGLNGSGKTSLLESIYLLGVGRSFRNHQIKTVISNEQQKLTVFGKLSGQRNITLGIERDLSGSYRVRINNEDQNRLSSLAKYLPVLVITPESNKLISGGPQHRRQYLDLSVFHVKHQFSERWQRYSKILKQRNALLKSCSSYKELSVWDVEFAALAVELDEARKEEFLQLKSHLEDIQGIFLPQYRVQYTYYSGWDSSSTQSFIQQLENNYQTDKRYGYTNLGAHKSDIKLTVNKGTVQDIFSRGEQKMLVNAMHLAQARRLSLGLDKNCMILIDDLPSELDEDKQHKLLGELSKLTKVQIFMTCISKEGLVDLNSIANLEQTQKELEVKWFHVKHGVVSETETNKD